MMPKPDTSPALPPVASSTISQPIHWPSVLQLGFSLLAMLGLWGMAFSLFLVSVMQKTGLTAAVNSPLSLVLTAAGFTLSGFLLLPSALYALARLINRPVRTGAFHITPALMGSITLSLPILFWLGNIVSNDNRLSVVFLPVIHLLTIGLPVLWLVSLGRWSLPAENPQRNWGIFASGLVLGPAIIMVVESLTFIGVAFMLAIWAFTQPALVNIISQMAQQLQSGSGQPTLVLTTLIPYLTKPAVIFTVMVFGAILVPLVEEAVKPIGVWLLVGKLKTPQAGFAAGVLSGAGYALFESLMLANTGQDWLYVTFGRLGTGIIHITTAALLSWALVAAWRKGSYLQLGLAYLVAVLIHGLWNGLTIAAVFTSLPQAFNGSISPLLLRSGEIASYGLAILAVAALSILLLANRMSRKASLADAATTSLS